MKWANGRVTLDESAHVLSRDPDAEIFLNSPGVSRRRRAITISAGRAAIEISRARTGRLSEISEWTAPDRLATATSSASAP